MSVYGHFKFFSLGSISQYGTPQQNMSNASSLYMTQLARKELNFHELSKLIEIAYCYK